MNHPSSQPDHLLPNDNPDTMLHAVLDSITDGFLTLDNQWVVQYWNRQAELLENHTRQEVIGRSLWDIFPEERGGHFHRQYERALRDQVTVCFEAHYETKNQWLDVTAYPSPRGITVYFRDVTTQKLSALRLAENEKKYRSLFDNAPLPQWIWEIDTFQILDVNAAALVHYGYSRAEFLAMTLMDIRPAAEIEKVRRFIEENTSIHKKSVWTHVTSSGAEITVEVSTTPVDYGGRAARLATINDITEKELAEQALRRSRSEYKKLFNCAALPQLIYRMDNLQIMKVNEAAIDHYGYSPDEFLALSALDLRPEEERGTAADYAREMQRVAGGRWVHRKKNGQAMQVETTARVLHYLGHSCMLVTINDVTEKLRLQQQMMELEVMAHKKLTRAHIRGQEQERQELGRELHDNINQLLTAANMYLDVAEHAEDLRLELIGKSREILSTAVREIRSLSKQLISPAMQELNFIQAVQELIDSYTLARKFRVHARYLDGLSALPEEIKITFYRILQEQLTNILKYAEATNIWIQFDRVGTSISMLIKDDGIGFDPAQRRHGVGLCNIKNRAELYNGTLVIDAQPGSGCGLRVVIPIETEADPIASGII